MSCKELFGDIFEYLLSLFFPNRCIFCDRVIAPFDEMCPECKENLPWIKAEICQFCGSSKSDCVCKKRHGHFYDGIISPLYFEDNVKNCIYNFKFRDHPNNAKVLASLMDKIRKDEYKDIKFDYVAYIPMNKKQKKRRGYNQCELLAQELSEVSGIPFGKDLIIKLYQTDTQHFCENPIQRTGNLLGVFDINPKYDLNGKNILLVDDVKTSGATLNECGKMMYLYGAESIYCLTAALVKSKIKKKEKKEGETC